MKILVSQAILASTLILGVAYQSFAEGNCPPGYYPIGGQGARGCAPIPSGAPSSTSSGGISELPANSPTGRWIKTWGGNRRVPVYSGRRSIDRPSITASGRARGVAEVQFNWCRRLLRQFGVSKSVCGLGHSKWEDGSWNVGAGAWCYAGNGADNGALQVQE